MSSAAVNPASSLWPAASATRPSAEPEAGRYEPNGRLPSFAKWFPLALAAAAPLTLILASPLVQLLQLTTGAIVAGLALASISTGRARLRLSRIFATGLLEAYSVGGLPDSFSGLTAHTAGLDAAAPVTHTYGLAICQIYLGVAILYLVGEFTEPYLPLPRFSPKSMQRLKAFVWIGTLATAIALVTGDIGYMGADSVNGADVNFDYFAIFLFWLLAPLVGTTATVLALAKTRKQKFLYGAALVFQGIAIAPTGRRSFLYALLLGFTLYCYWNPRFARSGWKLTAAFLAALLAITVMWTAFLYLRLASYTLEQGDAVQLRDLVSRAIVLYESGQVPEASKAWGETDATERVDIIGYQVLLLDLVARNSPAYGGGLFNEFKWTIPKVFWPGKNFLNEEDYASQLFHYDVPDQANSVFSAATIDFGFWGGLFYPVLLSWFLVATIKLYRWVFPPPFPYICVCVIIGLCMQAEVELFGYFLTVRTNLSWVALFVLLLTGPEVLRRRTLEPEWTGPLPAGARAGAQTRGLEQSQI